MIRKKDLLKQLEAQEKKIGDLRYELHLLYGHLKLNVLDIPPTTSQKKVVTDEEYKAYVNNNLDVGSLTAMQAVQSAYSNSARAFKEAKE